MSPPAADGATAPAAGPDAEMVVPPMARPPVDAGAPPDGGGGDGAVPVESLVGCSSSIKMIQPPMAGRDSYCTIIAGDRYTWMELDNITAKDPVSTRAYAVCSAPLNLGAETAPGNGVSGPLSPATLEVVVKLVNHYKSLCQPHGARLVGVLGSEWARAAANGSEIRARLKEAAGVELEVPSAEQQLQNRYYGVTRYRRGRIVVDTNWERPEILTWPEGAAAPVRTMVPLGYSTVSSMYFANATYKSWEEARRGLRARLTAEMETTLGDLTDQVRWGTLSPSVAVGPAGPLVPLALAGQLRSEAGTWVDVEKWNELASGAYVTTSAFGRSYGVILPGDFDHFFTSVGVSQFMQLRTNPLRDAYGLELFYVTTLLDVLADEVDATQFGFVFTNYHFGYLFTKVSPAPR
jgi:hypothetical protein